METTVSEIDLAREIYKGFFRMEEKLKRFKKENKYQENLFKHN